MTKKHILSLRILNTEQLESGRESNVTFQSAGGAIGSHVENKWSIQDLEQQIQPIHCNIIFNEDGYCFSAIAPHVFINNLDAYKQRAVIKLQSGDIIQLCDLKIRVYLSLEETVIDPLSIHPESLVSPYSDHLHEIMDKPIHPAGSSLFGPTATASERKDIDPLAVLDKESLSPLKNAIDADPLANTVPFSNFHSEEQLMDEQFLDLPKIHTQFDDNDNPSTVSLSPLLKGVGADIRLQNSQDVYNFMAEMGLSLRRTIEGLMKLHHTQNLFERKQLLPIEDNPLKLNLSYEKTINTMYGEDSSPVHLAPSSAIEESLNNICLHNKANQIATLEALGALLTAFSPENLSKRFLRYRRASEPQKPDNAWFWQMYRNYYQELVSDRQHGLDKLFKEVYEQTYDYELRRLQREELASTKG